MGNSSKTIFIVLGLATLAYGGYYFIAQKETVEPGVSDSSLQQMLTSTQSFIEYRQTLNQITFNFTLFEDDRFRTLRSYSEPVDEKDQGRPNPFAPVGSDSVSVTSS